MRELIVSRDNTLIKLAIRLASSRSVRRENGMFLCDGISLLPEALKHGVELIAILCAEKMELPSLPNGIRVVELPERLMHKVSPTETPRGLVFLCRLPSTAWRGFQEGGLYLLLDRVQDPGNVGSILRSASAFSATGVLLGPGCADPFSPKTVRAAMGAAFQPFIFETQDPAGVLRDCPLPIYAAILSDHAKDIRDVDLSSGVILLGNEGAGLSTSFIERADAHIKIPMDAASQSLGVAVAAAILLYVSRN